MTASPTVALPAPVPPARHLLRARDLVDWRYAEPITVDEPEERPYGIDAGFHDPSGNHLRLAELRFS